jgi:hypothetical protein
MLYFLLAYFLILPRSEQVKIIQHFKGPKLSDVLGNGG